MSIEQNSDTQEGSPTEEITLENERERVVLTPGRGGRWVSWRMKGLDGQPELFGQRGPDPRNLRIESAGHSGPQITPGTGPGGASGLIDHFMPLTTQQSDFSGGRAKEIGTFSAGAFEYVKYEVGRGWETAMQMNGGLRGARREVPVVMFKRVSLQAGSSEIAIHYRIENPGEKPLQVLFGVEFVFAVAAGSAGYYEIDGQREGGGFEARGLAPEVTTAALIEPQPGIAVRMGWEREATIWVAPSPAGATADTIQGASIMPVWDLRVPPEDNWAVGIWLQAGPAGPVAPIPPEVVARIQRYESEDEPWKTAKS